MWLWMSEFRDEREAYYLMLPFAIVWSFWSDFKYYLFLNILKKIVAQSKVEPVGNFTKEISWWFFNFSSGILVYWY